ncbi:hypothetical protein ACFYZH_09900 [Streptomyces abikoensis]|uniref:hypothetical protein n=1 Tax=Streptomyces abikoensis TaxID=97398 RepID=UPI00369FFF2B
MITKTPSLAFLADVTYTTGMYDAAGTSVAQLLMTHAPPRKQGETLEWVDAGMHALSACLGLGPVLQAPPDIGPRLTVHERIVSLDYGVERCRLLIPGTAQRWQNHVANGGSVRVLLAFEPTPASRLGGDCAAFIQHCIDADTVRWGTTYARLRRRLT